MKHFFTLLFLLTISWNGFSQGADIDKEYFPVSYVKLPSNPILNENERTYNIEVVANDVFNELVSTTAISNGIQIWGFRRDDRNPKVAVSINFSNIVFDPSSFKVIDELVERKDDDGNVISSYYLYHYVVPYAISASYSIANPLDLKLENDIKRNTEYVSDDFKSKKEAYAHFDVNKEEIKENLIYDFVENVSYRINGRINANFGYQPTKTNSYLWILDSKNNPLTSSHKSLFEEVKLRMETYTYDTPISKIRAEVQPFIEDFEKMAEGIDGGSRKERKVKYACYYNCAALSLAMDLPEKANEYANMILPLKYGERDAEKFIEEANTLKEILLINMVDNRRMIVPVDENFNKVVLVDESNYAFLVTAKNDTLITNMNFDDLRDVGNDVRVYLPDEKGNLKGEIFNASEVKELVFDENNIYVQKEFISYKDNPRAKEPQKYLVRKEFETEQLSIYTFKEEEVIFFIGDETVGRSNRSYKFLMGFKNELKKFTGTCTQVNDLIDKNYYKNNPASLRSFIEDVVHCE